MYTKGYRSPFLVGTLAVDRAHVGIPLPSGHSLWPPLLNARSILSGKRDACCGDILLEVVAMLGAGDRHNILALCQYPRQRKLACRDVLLARHLLYPLNERKILLEVLALEARSSSTPVVRGQVLDAGDLPGKKPAAQWAVGDEADSEFAHSGQNLVLRVAAPQRVFRLEGRDRVDGVRPPDGCRRGFREAEVAYLALLHQSGHRADRVLNRNRRGHTQLVIQIDVIDAKATQRAITGRTHIVRSAVDAHKGAILAPLVAKLRREHHLIPPALDRLPDEPLIPERAVLIGRVQKIHPKFQGAMNRRE